MANLKFRNLNRSPMEIGDAPKWQREIMEMVENGFSDEARKCNDEFRTRILEELADGKKLAGPVVDRIQRETSRLAYIKNIGDDRGRLYDAEIDLLNLTVTFLEI